MLINFALNLMDTFNIVYLWISLTRRESNNFLKLISSVIIISSLIAITNELGAQFFIVYIIDIVVIKIIYKKDFKNVLFGLLLTLLIIMLMQLILFLIINKFVYDYTIQGIVIELIIFACVVAFSKFNLYNKKFIIERITNSVSIYFIVISSIYVIILKFIWNYDNKIIIDNLFIAVVILIHYLSLKLSYIYMLLK